MVHILLHELGIVAFVLIGVLLVELTQEVLLVALILRGSKAELSGTACLNHHCLQSSLGLALLGQGVNLKSLRIGSDGEPFATAIYPISKYTDANGKQQTIGIYSVNNSIGYVQNDAAVARYGRIFKYVEYEGISDPSVLKRTAAADLVNKYLTRPTVYEVEAIDMTNIDGAAPLEVDTLVPIISTKPEVNTVEPLNVIDVDLVEPRNLQLKFNDSVRSLAGYRR